MKHNTELEENYWKLGMTQSKQQKMKKQMQQIIWNFTLTICFFTDSLKAPVLLAACQLIGSLKVEEKEFIVSFNCE